MSCFWSWNFIAATEKCLILCFKTFALGIKGIFAGNLGFSGAEDREGIGNLQISPEFTGMPSVKETDEDWLLS